MTDFSCYNLKSALNNKEKAMNFLSCIAVD